LGAWLVLQGPNSENNLVITGAAGFVGAHLACHLKLQGYSVTCLSKTGSPSHFNTVATSYGLDDQQFTWLAADVMDVDALLPAFTNASAVFHCAARVSFSPSQDEEMMEVNVTGTRNVCNACIRAAVPFLVHASSVAAIGRKPGAYSVTEDSDWVDSKLNTPYAISKHLAELEVWRAGEEGLKVSVVNPGIIIGYGAPHAPSMSLFKHVIKGSPWYPIGRNGIVSVQDVVLAMRLLFEQQLSGFRVLMVSENLYYKELLAWVAQSVGKPAPHKPLKGFLLAAAIRLAKLAEFFHIPFPFPSSGLVSTSSDTQYTPLNSSKIKDFSFTPIQSAIELAAKNIQA
jgi:nucleoside-diphosphate-sugar epimerase